MKRINPEDRRKEIIGASLDLVRIHGIKAITIAAVAERAGTSTATIHHYFTNLESLRSMILVEAVKVTDVRVIIQAVLFDPTYVELLTKDQRIIVLGEMQKILKI